MIAGLLIAISVILAALKLAGLLVTVTWFHALLPGIIGVSIIFISLVFLLAGALFTYRKVSRF